MPSRKPKSRRLSMLRVSVHEYRYRSRAHASGYRTGYLVRVTRQGEGDRHPAVERRWFQQRAAAETFARVSA